MAKQPQKDWGDYATVHCAFINSFSRHDPRQNQRSDTSFDWILKTCSSPTKEQTGDTGCKFSDKQRICMQTLRISPSKRQPRKSAFRSKKKITLQLPNTPPNPYNPAPLTSRLTTFVGLLFVILIDLLLESKYDTLNKYTINPIK